MHPSAPMARHRLSERRFLLVALERLVIEISPCMVIHICSDLDQNRMMLIRHQSMVAGIKRVVEFEILLTITVVLEEVAETGK